MKTVLKNHHKALFWILMVAAQIGAFVLFKDLADISQSMAGSIQP
jgi:hypothetical protein